MRVTTSQSYDRPSLMMATLNKQADRLQIEVSTQKKIHAPSDHAASWQQLATFARSNADDESYRSNIKLAQGLLAASDTGLGQIETQLQRAKTLALQANSDTLNAQDRAAIKVEVDAILEDVFALANSRDPRGYPLFGGSSGDAAFTRAGDGVVSWTGGNDPAPLPIGQGVEIAATTSGARAFTGISSADGTSDIFAMLSALSAALGDGGTRSGIERAMGDLDAALDHVGTRRASVGARAFRMDLEMDRLAEVSIQREEMRAGLEDADLASSITQLQKTLTILEATQASFTKLTSLTLFDYLR